MAESLDQLTTTAPLRAFIVTVRDDPERGAELVYARARNLARSIAAPYLEADYVETVAVRSAEHDVLAGKQTASGCERDPVVLRKLGWHSEGESSCDTCGLYPMDRPEFAVCDRCAQCKECGCTCTKDTL